MGLEAIGVAAAVSSAAGTAVSAYGAAEAGGEEARRLDRAALTAKTKGEQTARALQDELNSTVANIRAVRAATGTADGPMDDALLADQRAEGQRNINQSMTNTRAEVDEINRAAKAKRSGARMALISGAIGAVGDLTKGLAGAKKKAD